MPADPRASGTPNLLIGIGSSADARDTNRTSEQTIDSVVIPALIELLHASDIRGRLDSAVLALGRTARAERADEVIETAQPHLEHKELSVQTAATLCLGVLGSPEAVPVPTELMDNTCKGQRLSGGGDAWWLVRAFAAPSLGLINDPGSDNPPKSAISTRWRTSVEGHALLGSPHNIGTPLLKRVKRCSSLLHACQGPLMPYDAKPLDRSWPGIG